METRDVSIVADVFLNRVMTRSQIQTLHFGSVPRCNARLRQLYDWGYLARTYLPTAPFGSQALYTVGKASGLLLANILEQSGIQAQPLDVRRQSHYPALSLLEHTLAIGDVYIALRKSLAEHPHLRLAYWLPERFCRHEYEVRRQNENAYSQQRWQKEIFQPDGFFRLELGNGLAGRNFFIEADLGHTNSRQFRGKLRIHMRFLESGLFAETFGWQQFETLVVTTGTQRADNLRTLARQEDCAMFRFTTFATVEEYGLFAPIWQDASEQEPFSLL